MDQRVMTAASREGRKAAAGVAAGRYLALDAMRGVAAVAVVLFHYHQSIGGFEPTFGFLAVDLFFVLSGFVIAKAYDGRFSRQQMSAKQFMSIRIRRLAPLYLLGGSLGLAALFVGSHGAWHGPALFVATMLNLLGIPAVGLIAKGESFPLNPPFWSLFLELWIANLAYGLFWRQLRGALLYGLIGACAVALLVAARSAHTMNFGWSVSDVPAGFTRVGFSFFAGIAIARIHTRWPPRLSLPPYAILLAICAALIVPLHTAAAQAFGLMATLFLFPAAVYLGAVQWERAPRLGAWLGEASYALYAIHAPVVHVLAVLFGGAIALKTLGAEAAFCAVMVALAFQAARWDEALRATWKQSVVAAT